MIRALARLKSGSIEIWGSGTRQEFRLGTGITESLDDFGFGPNPDINNRMKHEDRIRNDN